MSTSTIGFLGLAVLVLTGCGRGEAPQEEPAATSSPVRIVFFGDSITEAGVQPGGYVTLVEDSLRRLYPERSIEVIGAGIGGHKVPDLQARLERDVLSKRPTHVVIYIGINDVWHFYEFDGVTGTERNVYEQGLRDLIAQMRGAGAEVVLCTPSVIGEDPNSDTEVNQHLIEYAELSRTIAQTTEAHGCDLRAAFGDYLGANNPDKVYEGILTSDGVHLNDAGNRFVARYMVEQLVPLL